MKRLLFFVAAAASMAACTNDATALMDDARTVVFNLSADGLSSPTFTRATGITSSDMTDVWIFDFVNEECVQYLHITPEDESWNSPSMTLARGTHNICFLASRGEDPTLDEDAQTVTWSAPRDAFWCDKDVEITQGTSSVSAVLNRVATKLRIVVTDQVPAGAKTITATPAKWYYGINYWTGEPASQQQRDRSVTIPDAYIGTSGQLAVSFFGISGSREWTTDVTLTATDADGNPFTNISIAAAPFKANRATEYSGRLFSESPSWTLSLNDEWETPYTGEW